MKNRILLSGWLIFILVTSISFFKLDVWHPTLYKYIFMAGFGLAAWNGILAFVNWKKHTLITRWSSIVLLLCYLAVFAFIIFLMLSGSDSRYNPA